MAVRRLSAFALDWLVVALWGGVLFGVVMLATGGEPGRPGSPWSAQAVGVVAMTLPVVLYFAGCECSAMRATLGKRVLRLVVTDAAQRRLPFAAALGRNAVKFVPWECGHLVAHQAMFAGDEGPAWWAWGAAIVAMGVPLWWVGALLLTGAMPYDRWTATQVMATTNRGR